MRRRLRCGKARSDANSRAFCLILAAARGTPPDFRRDAIAQTTRAAMPMADTRDAIASSTSRGAATSEARAGTRASV